MKRLLFVLIAFTIIGLACEKPFWDNKPEVKMKVTAYLYSKDGMGELTNGGVTACCKRVFIDTRDSENLFSKRILYLCNADSVSDRLPHPSGLDTLVWEEPGEKWIRVIGKNNDGEVDSLQINFTVR
jgi:hypothetical protein